MSDFSTLSVAAQVELLQRWSVPFQIKLSGQHTRVERRGRTTECLSATLAGIKPGLPSVE